MNFLKTKDEQKDTASSVGKRRKFLSGAAGAGAVALGFRPLAFRARVLHDTHGQAGEQHDEDSRRARDKRAITLREFSQTIRD